MPEQSIDTVTDLTLLKSLVYDRMVISQKAQREIQYLEERIKYVSEHPEEPDTACDAPKE